LPGIGRSLADELWNEFEEAFHVAGTQLAD